MQSSQEAVYHNNPFECFSVRSDDAVSPTSDDTTDSAEPLMQVTYRARPGRRQPGPGMKMTATSGTAHNVSSGSSMDGHAAENAV